MLVLSNYFTHVNVVFEFTRMTHLFASLHSHFMNVIPDVMNIFTFR